VKYKFCYQCGSLNRISDQKVSERTPICGKCSAEIDHLEAADHISEAQLDKLIRNSERLIVVDIYADWCGPCKVYSPIFSKVGANEYLKAEFVKLNIDQAQSFAQKFGVRGVPATLFFKGGRLVNQLGGLINESQLSQEVRAWN